MKKLISLPLMFALGMVVAAPFFQRGRGDVSSPLPEMALSSLLMMLVAAIIGIPLTLIIRLFYKGFDSIWLFWGVWVLSAGAIGFLFWALMGAHM